MRSREGNPMERRWLSIRGFDQIKRSTSHAPPLDSGAYAARLGQVHRSTIAKHGMVGASSAVKSSESIGLSRECAPLMARRIGLRQSTTTSDSHSQLLRHIPRGEAESRSDALAGVQDAASPS